MNSLASNKTPGFPAPMQQLTGGFRLRPVSLVMFSVLIIFALLYSLPASANRPAADEGNEQHDAAETNEAPSSVGIMMQQQSRQNGDVLQLPAQELQVGETVPIKLLDSPRRGMIMEKVRQQYGEPLSITDSVGKPPITRWTYHDRIVYFEHSTVLHAVAR